jgi:protein-disulfide isomerase
LSVREQLLQKIFLQEASQLGCPPEWSGIAPMQQIRLFMKADVAIVIVTYNSEENIGACLESVFANRQKVVQEVIVVDNQSRDGTVKLIQRDFPLNKPAVQAAQLAHCAGPMRYFALVDVLFKTQDQWLTEDAVEKLATIAATAGMDRPTFDACLANKDIEAKIVATRKAGEDAFGINATPTFIINGESHSGEMPYEDFKALLETAMAG